MISVMLVFAGGEQMKTALPGVPRVTDHVAVADEDYTVVGVRWVPKFGIVEVHIGRMS